jgi:hypothetical protein
LKRKLIFAGSALVLVWLLYPPADIVSPDWHVLVTDTEGRPIAGASVTVFSQQYAIERQDHEVTRITGADGRAHFNERRIRAMNLVRLIGAIRNLDQGAHASFGVHTHLHASAIGFGDPSSLDQFGKNEHESHANGAAQQSSTIVLMKCPGGFSGIGCTFPEDSNTPTVPSQ